MKKGFTLIELLVVISIISLLTSMVGASVSQAKREAQDARNLANLHNVTKALEMYYSDHGQYPLTAGTSANASLDCASQFWDPWCSLETALKPYIDLHKVLDPDPQIYFFYGSDTGDGGKTYGLAVDVKSSKNYNLAANDGGFYNGDGNYKYELGTQPRYCMQKYVPPLSDWLGSGINNTVCLGGN